MADEFESVELEISEDDILYYLVSEDGEEIGFVIEEDGQEVECYYEGFDVDEFEIVDEVAETGAPEEPEQPADHGYLYKMASIAGHTGNKARKKASKELEKVRGKAEAGVEKATETVEAGGEKLKAKKDDYDLGITREGVAEATSDLNVIAKEGAATAKELKEAYDDIMDSFGFLVPKKVRRRLP